MIGQNCFKTKIKNGQNDEIGAQLSQMFCLPPVVTLLARKGTLLAERAPYSPEKGTTETDHKTAEGSLILQATRYQAKCEA